MYTNFHKLADEKQRQIINVAMQEFIQYGFEKASTNAITSNAKISKGALFHYFNTKKELYLYLLEYSTEVIEKLYEQIDLSETDLFARLENIGLQKMKIQQKYPRVFDFLTSTKDEKSAEVKEVIMEKKDRVFQEGIAKIYDKIDYSPFREDLDLEKAVEILNWTMFGFSEKALRQIDSFENSEQMGEEFFRQWRSYSEILKKSFYK